MTLWDVEKAEPRGVLRGFRGEAIGLSWSPDGTRLATASHDQSVRLWDIQSYREIVHLEAPRQGTSDFFSAVAWSPTGELLATNKSAVAKIWDVQTQKVIHTLIGHVGKVHSLSWSPDGQRLATSGFVDGTVRIWGTVTSREIAALEIGSRGVVVSWSPDGRRLAAGNSNGLNIWDSTWRKTNQTKPTDQRSIVPNH